MNQIEPIRLDMNLFNSAIGQAQHQQALAETQRHHGILEQQNVEAMGATQKKIQLDAAENVLKDPDATPFEQYTALNSRLKIMGANGPIGHEDVTPTDFMDNSSAWKTFATKIDMATSAQSPEVAAAMQELSQRSPAFKKQAQKAIAFKQQQDVQKGFQSMPTRAGQPALSPQESSAVQTSPPAQKAIAESAFPSAKDTAVMNEVNQRTAGLKVQEATATYAYQALNKEMTPVFNMDAETAHVQNLSRPAVGGPLSSRLSTKESTDQSALMSGTLTTEERQQAKQAIPEVMKEMNQRGRMLQQELNNAKHDVTGQARPPEQIQAELAAIRTAVTIKGKELSYLNNSNPATRKELAQSYESFQKDLDQKKAEVLRLRQASSGVAQGALNEKIEQDIFQRRQITGLAEAQAHYKEHKNLLQTAKLFPDIPMDKIREIDKDLNRPMVNIEQKMTDTATEAASKNFMQKASDSYEMLKFAPSQLQNLAEAKALIPKAKGFMGPGGESLLEASKFMNNRLGMSINTEGVKGAEELRSRIFFNIMDNLKKMDAQPSQMQQMIMMESLGKLGTDPNALTHVLDAYEDSIRNKVTVHNETIDSAEKRGVKLPFEARVILPKRHGAEKNAPEKSGTLPSQEDYDKLPSGSIYKAPDGKMRKKK